MSKYKKGRTVSGTVTGIEKYGIFVSLDEFYNGLIHISEVSNEYVEDINQVVKKGDTVKVKILSIDDNGKIALSIKNTLENK